MKSLLSITLLLIIASATVKAQEIYSKAFGSSENPAIIFLHGGPGYNSANFEATTAQQMADSGFYVIVYDRRGEGRSIDPDAKFTMAQTTADLETVYSKYDISTASLIGHSFGGIVASSFAKSNPKKVKSIVMVGAPVSFQSTLKTIISKSKAIYTQKNDGANLNYIGMLEKMDTSSLEYSSYCFMHAMQNGFYSPSAPTPQALALYATFRTDTLLTKYASQMTREAPMGFWKNEKYTSTDLTKTISSLQKKDISFYGLYGKDDGLFSENNVTQIKKLIGENNVDYIDNCSHNVFIDQQSQFITSIKKWLK